MSSLLLRLSATLLLQAVRHPPSPLCPSEIYSTPSGCFFFSLYLKTQGGNKALVKVNRKEEEEKKKSHPCVSLNSRLAAAVMVCEEVQIQRKSDYTRVEGKISGGLRFRDICCLHPSLPATPGTPTCLLLYKGGGRKSHRDGEAGGREGELETGKEGRREEKEKNHY